MPTPSGVLFQNPIVKPLSANGAFMAACTATFYLTGTTTLANVYADGALTTPLANPLSADASGTFVAIYLNPAITYRVQIKTSTGVLISDTDPYTSPVNAQSNFTGAPTDVANVFFKRTAAYSGGPVGNTIACLKVQSDVSAGVTDFEWAFLSILNNSATGGQNVAGFFQGNRQTSTTGPTFAAVFEARDLSGVANNTSGLVGIEVDCRAPGTDSSLNRVGIDVVCSRPLLGGGFTGAAATISYGVRIGNGGDATTTIGAGYTVFSTNVGYAFDCANATVTAGALRMPSGAAILFDGPGVNQLSFDGAGLRYNVNGSPVARFNQNGTLNIGTGAFGAGAAIISQVVVPTAAQNTSVQLSDTLAGTTVSDGLLIQSTIAAAVTAANYRGAEVKNPILNAGALITNLSGIYVNDLTQGGTLNAALNLNVVAAAGKYNVYAPGTAQNFFAGPMSFGTFTLSAVAQTGYITITDNTGVTRRLLVG